MSIDIIPIKTRQIEVTIATKLKQLAKRFIAEQQIVSSSRKQYERTLKYFFIWVYKIQNFIEEEVTIEDVYRNGIDLGDITRLDILNYVEFLFPENEEERRYSSLTAGGYLNTVKCFYKFLEGYKLYPNIAAGVKAPRRKNAFKKQPLTLDKTVELIDYIKDKNLREKALITLLVSTGLRTITIHRAKVRDIEFRAGKRILLVQRKGALEKDDFVVLSDKVFSPIAKYLESRGELTQNAPLFASSSNNSKEKSLSTRTISGTAKAALKAIQLDSKSFTAHSLRHTTATNIRRLGGSLEDIQGVLGHKSINTSQIYDKIFREEQRIQNAPELLLDSIL